PHGAQTENHLIDNGSRWTKVRKASLYELQSALDPVRGALWDNSSASSNGLHDRVAKSKAAQLGNLLKLIQVSDLSIEVALEGSFGKRKVRGKFSLNGIEYKLVITDPVMEKKYKAGKNGQFDVGNAILCISLGDTYRGFAYKLIAGAVLPPAT